MLEETTKDITSQRFTAHKYQGTVTLSARHEKAKTISILLVTLSQFAQAGEDYRKHLKTEDVLYFYANKSHTWEA